MLRRGSQWNTEKCCGSSLRNIVISKKLINTEKRGESLACWCIEVCWLNIRNAVKWRHKKERTTTMARRYRFLMSFTSTIHQCLRHWWSQHLRRSHPGQDGFFRAVKLLKDVVDMWLISQCRNIKISSPVIVSLHNSTKPVTTTSVIRGVRARIASANALSQALPFSGNTIINPR